MKGKTEYQKLVDFLALTKEEQDEIIEKELALENSSKGYVEPIEIEGTIQDFMKEHGFIPIEEFEKEMGWG